MSSKTRKWLFCITVVPCLIVLTIAVFLDKTTHTKDKFVVSGLVWSVFIVIFLTWYPISMII